MLHASEDLPVFSGLKSCAFKRRADLQSGSTPRDDLRLWPLVLSYNTDLTTDVTWPVKNTLFLTSLLQTFIHVSHVFTLHNESQQTGLVFWEFMKGHKYDLWITFVCQNKTKKSKWTNLILDLQVTRCHKFETQKHTKCI